MRIGEKQLIIGREYLGGIFIDWILEFVDFRYVADSAGCNEHEKEGDGDAGDAEDAPHPFDNAGFGSIFLRFLLFAANGFVFSHNVSQSAMQNKLLFDFHAKVTKTVEKAIKNPIKKRWTVTRVAHS